MSDSAIRNPYGAPTQDAQPAGLPPDTEFLVSGDCLLCEDRVQLPQVCVLTGTRTDLLTRTCQVKWTPQWMRSVLILLCVLILPAAGAAAQIFLIGNVPVTLTAGITVLLSAMASASIGLMIILTRGWRRVVVVYCIDRDLDQRQQRRQQWLVSLAAISGVAILAAAVMVWVAAESGMLNGGLSVLLVMAALMLWIRLLRAARAARFRPLFLGRYRGLNVLTGMSADFFQQIRAIIARQG